MSKPTIEVITKEWIDQNKPCVEALKWYKDYLGKSPIVILKRLIKAEKYDWANWFIVRVMEYKDYVSYAVFAAEQILPIFEEKYPDDKRPRQAIEAAKRCIKDPSEENKKAAWAAAWTAWTAEAAWAAWTARAAGAAWTAEVAWAAEAAWAAGVGVWLKILNYGMKLLEER